MKSLENYVNEANTMITKTDAIKDYNATEYLETKKEKQEMAAKYGIDSIKKNDIEYAILLKLRDIRNSVSKYDDDDALYFMRLIDYSTKKLPEFLKEETPEFVTFFQEYYKNKFMTGKLSHWIGINPGNNVYNLSYADKSHIKFYNKILEFIANNLPKERTADDDIFDSLVNKFTDLLKDYKEEYLKRVAEYAKKKYTEILPKDLASYKEAYKKIVDKLDKLDWRNDEDEWKKAYDIKHKLSGKIDRISSILKKYTLSSFIDENVNTAKAEFEDNIKTLSRKIMDDGLAIDKLVVKSVHDDPKVFNMKITDGSKNLFCRSIIAAMNSEYMIPHYRFIITNRTKDDSNYND